MSWGRPRATVIGCGGLTPYRMVMTLMALFAGTRVESLVDLQRGFNALFGYAMDYKPFYDQLAKREFATFMRETARRLLETLVIRVLGVAPGGAFSEFRRIVIQDGSSFAIKDALKEVFPGRFKKVKPAAVELHTTLDLLDESLSKVTLTADTASERAALPKASSLGGCLAYGRPRVLRPGLSLGTDQGGGELRHPCPERLESKGAGGL